MNNDILIIKEFKKNLISFFDELIDQFPAEGDLIIIRIYFKDQVNMKDILELFTHHLNKDNQSIKEKIKERDESFFLDNSIFDCFGKSKILHFKKIWRSPILDRDDKLIIWKWIDSFVFLADKYAKNKQI